MITFILAVCGNVDYVYSFPQSPPSRAAWIEMMAYVDGSAPASCRRLHGRRGLKFAARAEPRATPPSPPSRAAWIEMLPLSPSRVIIHVAAFTGGVD